MARINQSVAIAITLLSLVNASSIPEAFVKDNFKPVGTVTVAGSLGMCESDCDVDSDCMKGLVCADKHKNALNAIGLNNRTANCYNANTPTNLEVCFDPKILNTAGAGGGKSLENVICHVYLEYID